MKGAERGVTKLTSDVLMLKLLVWARERVESSAVGRKKLECMVTRIGKIDHNCTR